MTTKTRHVMLKSGMRRRLEHRQLERHMVSLLPHTDDPGELTTRAIKLAELDARIDQLRECMTAGAT